MDTNAPALREYWKIKHNIITALSCLYEYCSSADFRVDPEIITPGDTAILQEFQRNLVTLTDFLFDGGALPVDAVNDGTIIFAKAGQHYVEGHDAPFNSLEEAWEFAGLDPEEPIVEEAEEADEKQGLMATILPFKGSRLGH